MKKRSASNNLDKERTLLANERTMLAHIRTAFAALIFGFALVQFGGSNIISLSLGTLALIAAVAFSISGPVRYYHSKKRIHLHFSKQ